LCFFQKHTRPTAKLIGKKNEKKHNLEKICTPPGACVDESHVEGWSFLGSLCNQSLGPSIFVTKMGIPQRELLGFGAIRGEAFRKSLFKEFQV